MLANLIASAALLLAGSSTASPVQERQTFVAKHNDFTCKSTTHPNPVVLFHGLGATYYEDINELELYLQQNGFCTFDITYGAYPGWPYVGGLKPINESAAQLATFVKQVHAAYPNAKVDFVGHSEGAFQTLYIPKFESGISSIVDNVVAIAPPSHGTSFGGVYSLSDVGGALTQNLTRAILEVGCAACDDLVDGGGAVMRLDNGPIAQSGVKYTIMISKDDELVTPPYTAFVNETGVRNFYIQDYCPNDPVGHIGEAYDTNVWQLVKNTLSGSTAGPTTCSYGSPGR